MPCRSDYMEPTDREHESVLVMKLLNFCLPLLKIKVPKEVKDNLKNPYGMVNLLDKHTALLCKTVGGMTHDEQNFILFDGRNKMSRQLADWWESHQVADAKREKQEREEREEEIREAKKILKKHGITNLDE